MDQMAVGFPEFRPESLRTLEPMLAAARSFVQIGREMMNAPVSQQFPDLAKQITQTVGNSMESVVILVSNGCGVDAMRLTRTMFEAAIVLHYLESHPELVQDFIDYQWVIQKKHQDYRLGLPPDKVPPLSPEKIAEMESNYQRVICKRRFACVLGMLLIQPGGSASSFERLDHRAQISAYRPTCSYQIGRASC